MDSPADLALDAVFHAEFKSGWISAKFLAVMERFDDKVGVAAGSFRGKIVFFSYHRPWCQKRALDSSQSAVRFRNKKIYENMEKF